MSHPTRYPTPRARTRAAGYSRARCTQTYPKPSARLSYTLKASSLLQLSRRHCSPSRILCHPPFIASQTLLEAYATYLEKSIVAVDPSTISNVHTDITIQQIVQPQVVTRRTLLALTDETTATSPPEADGETAEEPISASPTTSSAATAIVAGLAAHVIGGPIATAVALAAATPASAAATFTTSHLWHALRNLQGSPTDSIQNHTIPGYADVNFRVSGSVPPAAELPAALNAFFDSNNFSTSPDRFMSRCPSTDHVPCASHAARSLIVTLIRFQAHSGHALTLLGI